jgi:hypothetical protein
MMLSEDEGLNVHNQLLRLKGLGRKGLSCLIVACSMSLAACQSLRSEEGALVDAIRSAGAVVSASGYPDLSKVPNLPKNLPSEKNWADFEAGLKSDARRLSLTAGAQPITPMEIDQAWASQARTDLEASPNALPIETSPTDDANWAAKARAGIAADIARLPPS